MAKECLHQWSPLISLVSNPVGFLILSISSALHLKSLVSLQLNFCNWNTLFLLCLWKLEVSSGFEWLQRLAQLSVQGTVCPLKGADVLKSMFYWCVCVCMYVYIMVCYIVQMCAAEVTRDLTLLQCSSICWEDVVQCQILSSVHCYSECSILVRTAFMFRIMWMKEVKLFKSSINTTCERNSERSFKVEVLRTFKFLSNTFMIRNTY